MEIAGLGRRVGGCLIDLFIVAAVISVFGMAYGQTPADGVGFNFEGPAAIAVFAVGFAYYIVTEALWGGTLGKLALGMRVVGEDGAPIDWTKSIIRNLLRIVDGLLLYLVGFIIAMMSQKTQRLGDIAAKTVVVKV